MVHFGYMIFKERNMTADCHTHSLFSPDGTEKPRDLIETAIKQGLTHIAITDHADLMTPDNFTGIDGGNIDRYIDTLLALKEEYKNKIYVCVGLEIGYTPQSEQAAKELVSGIYPEYVVNSVHYVRGSDCYAKEHFADLDKAEAYGQYLEAVRQSLNCPYRFDAVGHLGYIERFAPYEDARITFREFSEQITDIFETIIRKGAILEANTSVSGAPSASLPSEELFKIYYDMGGRKITTSSDAHLRIDIGRKFAQTEAMLKKIGFEYLTVKQNGEQRQLKF